jgi:hypothetical protein
MTVSTLDIVLFNMVSFLGGVFTGMFAGIRLRNTMLKSRSRDNLSGFGQNGNIGQTGGGGGHTGDGNTMPGLYPPIVPSAPVAADVGHSHKHNEIVIRTTE